VPVRILRDPSSISFAQLAEEHRRAGHFEEAVRICRVGLAHHPGFLSARVTLGQSLLAQGEVEDATAQFRAVLRAAPDHLAALRSLADIHRRRGEVAEAVQYFRAALALVPGDKELSGWIAALEPEPPDPLDVSSSASSVRAAVHVPERPSEIGAGAAVPAGSGAQPDGGEQPDADAPAEDNARAVVRLNSLLAVVLADRARRARGDAVP